MPVFGKKTVLQSNKIVYDNFQSPTQREGNGFDCNVCGKSYKQKGHLKRHYAIHSGTKPFCCPVCGKNFTRKDVMRTHLLVHDSLII